MRHSQLPHAHSWSREGWQSSSDSEEDHASAGLLSSTPRPPQGPSEVQAPAPASHHCLRSGCWDCSCCIPHPTSVSTRDSELLAIPGPPDPESWEALFIPFSDPISGPCQHPRPSAVPLKPMVSHGPNHLIPPLFLYSLCLGTCPGSPVVTLSPPRPLPEACRLFCFFLFLVHQASRLSPSSLKSSVGPLLPHSPLYC